MRRLEFGPADAGRRFIICYQSLCFAEVSVERNELRAHGSLLTKLEGIGRIANPAKGEMEPFLYNCQGGGDVIVTEQEFTLLKRFVVGFMPKISRALSREYAATLDWVDNVAELKGAPAASIGSAPQAAEPEQT